jgi:hypothetical protein
LHTRRKHTQSKYSTYRRHTMPSQHSHHPSSHRSNSRQPNPYALSDDQEPEQPFRQPGASTYGSYGPSRSHGQSASHRPSHSAEYLTSYHGHATSHGQSSSRLPPGSYRHVPASYHGQSGCRRSSRPPWSIWLSWTIQLSSPLFSPPLLSPFYVTLSSDRSCSPRPAPRSW